LGWFEFRICNVDGWKGDATNECFEKNVLQTSKNRLRVDVKKDDYGEKNYTVLLPPDLTCDHCVFQVSFNKF